MSGRIRVVQMMYTFDVEAGGGGLSRFALELGQKLDPERFEVIFCSLGYYSTPIGQQWIDRLREQGYWAFEANPRWSDDKAYIRFLRAVDNMRKAFWRSPVHILHSHSEYTEVAAILLKPLMPRTRLIRTIQYGYQDEWRHRPALRSLLTNFAYPLLMEAEVGVNRAITDRLNRRIFARLLKRRSERIYNAILLDRFTSRYADPEMLQSGKHDRIAEKKTSLGIPVNAPVIGSVGRLTEQKAYHILLKAAPSVLAAFPDAYFLIVGGGDLTAQIHQQARELDLGERCIFTGVRQDVEELLPCMDIFVSTSLWEGVPSVIMEAMACQVPVIATDIPGTNELVEHDVNGFLVPPADPETLASAILHLLNSTDSKQRFTQAALATLPTFSVERVTGRYEALYNQIMRRK